MIANVYASIRRRFTEKTVREVLGVVSNDTGVCVRTVEKYKALCLSGKVASPKRRPRNVKVSSTRTVKHDGFTLNAIRLKVHRKYSEREIPTLDSCQRRRQAARRVQDNFVEVAERRRFHF